MVWASLPVQLSNPSVQLVWRGSVKELSTTPLNSFKQGKLWQHQCIEIRHMKKLRIPCADASAPTPRHFSWPWPWRNTLLWAMVWASLPVQSVHLVWRESVKHFSTTPLSTFKRGKSWQCPTYWETAREKVVNRRHTSRTLASARSRWKSVVTERATDRCL